MKDEPIRSSSVIFPEVDNTRGQDSYHYQPGRRKLCAILLNPSPNPTGTVSVRNVDAVASHLGYKQLHITNLVNIETRESKSLSSLAAEPGPWLDARPSISEAVRDADDILFAWGHSPLPGRANRHKNIQIQWILDEVRRVGHTVAWMMDGLPRHPSRWHQYVGPKRGLINGGDFAYRAATMLTRTPIPRS